MNQLKLLGKLFLNVLSHVNIALSISLLTLFVTDRFNRAMAFINNDITKWMLAVFCFTVFIEAVIHVYTRRKAATDRNNAIDTKQNPYGDQ